MRLHQWRPWPVRGVTITRAFNPPHRARILRLGEKPRNRQSPPRAGSGFAGGAVSAGFTCRSSPAGETHAGQKNARSKTAHPENARQ